MRTYHCYSCGRTFDHDIENAFGTYEFRRCPACGGARTTLDDGLPAE